MIFSIKKIEGESLLLEQKLSSKVSHFQDLKDNFKFKAVIPQNKL